MRSKGKLRKYLAGFIAIIMIFAMIPLDVSVLAEGTSTTYFVAMNGDDKNPGTIDKPVRNASSLVSKLQPGDVVAYREGFYNDKIILDSKGSSDKEPIIFKSYEGESVSITSDYWAYVFYVGHCQNIKFEGLIFTGTSGEQRGTVIDINQYEQGRQQTKDITVTNCKFIDCSHGVQVRDVIESGADKKFGNIEISNNIFMSSNPDVKYGEGIYLQECRVQSGCYAKIYNNVIINAQKSLKLWGRSENVLFYNNTMLDTYDQVGGSGEYDIYPVQGTYNKGIYPDPDISYHCVFKNNIFTKPIRTQLEANATLLDKDKGNVFENNVYDSSSLKSYVTYNYGGEGPRLTFEQLQQYESIGHEQKGIYADVKFVDVEADGRLDGNNNSTINTASSEIVSGVSAPETDILGAKRTNEAGAYAFDSEIKFVGTNSGEADGTFSKPYNTIKDAVTAGAKKIEVKSGSYTEDGLAIPAGTTVTSYANGKVIINGAVSLAGDTAKVVLVSNIAFNGNVTVNGQNVSFKSCTFNSSVTTNEASNTVFDGCKFTNCTNALTLNNSTNVKITNNLFKDNTVAITLNGTSNKNVIYNNTFVGNKTNDLLFKDSTTNNSIKNNIFSAQNVIVGTNIIDYNCYNIDTLTKEYLDTISEPNCKKTAPGFTNEKSGDYRLYKLSACAKSGIIDENTPSKDINGISRKGALSDIGAYCMAFSEGSYYVSPIGNDNNSGTQIAPFATIGQAAKRIRDGEKIIIMAGTYSENIIIDSKTGTAGFVFEAKEGETVNVNGSVTVKNSKNVTLKGLTVTGTTSDLMTIENSENITVNHVTLNGGTTGVKMVSSKNVSVASSIVTNSSIGISMDNSTANMTCSKIKGAVTGITLNNASDLTLTASVIISCKDGIVSQGESSFNIINNTFYNNSGYSIDVTQAVKETALNIYNNIFSRATRIDAPFVSINKTTGFNTENNLYDADETINISVICKEARTLAKLREGGDDTCSLVGAPLFKDAGNDNFAPTKESPIARKGREATDYPRPQKDFMGKDFDKMIDIGAYYSPYTMKTWHVAPQGIGWSDGDGVNYPFNSLKTALSKAKCSDTIIVHKGEYKEGRIDLSNFSGVEDARCTIKGCDNPDCEWCKQYDPDNNPAFSGWDKVDRATFCGTWSFLDITKDVAKDELFMKLVDCNYLTIENIDIAGFTDAGIWVYGGDHVELKNLNIHNIDHKAQSNSGVQGVLANDATNCTFKDINIWDIGYTRKSAADHGMYIGYATDCLFDNIVVYQSPGGGIQLYAGDNYNIHAKNNIIQNSIFSECLNGLIVCGNESLKVVNNTFHNSRENDLYLDWNVTGCTFQNNLFYNDQKSTGTSGSIIARHNGGGDNKVTGNTFTNCVYDYTQQQPLGVEGWHDRKPIEEFISTQNSSGLNTFTSFNKGKAKFVSGVIDKNLSVTNQVKQIRDGLFQILLSSDCVDKGLALNAPKYDFAGVLRTGLPDIGAYEGKDVRTISLSNDSIDENNTINSLIGEFIVLGEDINLNNRFELVAGEGSEDNASFIINGNKLLANESFDYETKSAYKLRVKVTLASGGVLEKSFVININNVEENPIIEDYIDIVPDDSITVDGIINEDTWTNSFAELVYGKKEDSEFRAKMAFKADSKNLYVAADVTDDEVINNLIPGSDFNADLIEVYLDGLNREGASYDESTLQFQFRYNDPKVYAYNTGALKEVQNVIFKFVEKDGGYSFEASIPWLTLGVTFNKDKTIGLAAGVQDYDKNSEGGYLDLVNGSGFWNNKSAWRTYGFKKLLKPGEKKDFIDINTGVNLSVSSEIIESIGGDPSFEVKDITSTTQSQINVGTAKYNMLKAYKINMRDKNGNAITVIPNGNNVTIRLPYNGVINQKYVVIRDGNTIIDATYNLNDKTIEFVTDHFSEFVIVKAKSQNNSGGTVFSQYQITATTGEGGTITPAGEIMVDRYADQTYKITPNKGYKVDKVIVDGTREVSLIDDIYVFFNVCEPYTIHATFKKIEQSKVEQPNKDKPTTNPKTGDSSMMYMYALAFALAGTTLIRFKSKDLKNKSKY